MNTTTTEVTVTKWHACTPGYYNESTVAATFATQEEARAYVREHGGHIIAQAADGSFPYLQPGAAFNA